MNEQNNISNQSNVNNGTNINNIYNNSINNLNSISNSNNINNVQVEPVNYSNDINSSNNIINSNTISNVQVEPINYNNGVLNSSNDTNVKKSNKKLFIILSIIGVLFIVVGFFVFQLLFPKISLVNFKESYDYGDFVDIKKVVKSSLFVNKDKTIWNINGYDFYKGKETTYIPVNFGDNTLIIKNGSASKTYKFKVNKDESSALLLTDKDYIIPIEHLDFDGDGISNLIEKEKGLSTYSNDTDGDGILDNVELVMGLDPKEKDDYNESRNYKVYQDDSKDYEHYLEVTGKGNIANTFLDTDELNIGFPSGFVQTDVLNVVTSNIEKPDKMTIYFKKNNSWDSEKYSIYKYDENDGSLEEVKASSNEEYLFGDISLFDNLYFVGRKDKAPTSEYNNQIMILIDNSGSMFTKEYVAEKKNTTVGSNVNDNDYSHDIDFKRLSLMTSLVDRLGTDNYTYSVYAFTNSYCDITVNSKDKDTIISGINSLKTECQNFNGTDVSGAVRKYSSKFDTNSYGKKYMIVLTDGKDSGLFTYELSDTSLKNYAKKGINIITIGLSEFTDSEYLMKIASKTNGKYLYASDANMLDDLIEIIESSINGQAVTEMDGKEVTLVADSGFKVERDGFSFGNFTSTTSPGGVCAGFSYVSKQIYLNQLPESEEEVSEDLLVGEKLIAYNLTENNKKRLVKGNVYNIELNNSYSTLLNVDSVNEDYRYLGDDGIPYLSNKYKDMALASGYSPYIKDDNPTKISINGESKIYSKYETLGLINLIDAKVSDENQDDYQVLQLLNRGWAVQTHNVLKLVAKHFKMLSQGEYYDYEEQVKSMIIELQSGSPAMLSISSSIGNHSVMATNVYKTNDLEKYIIGIYDSNAPDKEAKMYLERQVSSEKFSETSYYSINFTSAGLTFNKMLYQK